MIHWSTVWNVSSQCLTDHPQDYTRQNNTTDPGMESVLWGFLPRYYKYQHRYAIEVGFGQMSHIEI